MHPSVLRSPSVASVADWLQGAGQDIPLHTGAVGGGGMPQPPHPLSSPALRGVVQSHGSLRPHWPLGQGSGMGGGAWIVDRHPQEGRPPPNPHPTSPAQLRPPLGGRGRGRILNHTPPPCGGSPGGGGSGGGPRPTSSPASPFRPPRARRGWETGGRGGLVFRDPRLGSPVSVG